MSIDWPVNYLGNCRSGSGPGSSDEFRPAQLFRKKWQGYSLLRRSLNAAEGKRILALFIEDGTLIKQREITVAVRFRRDATTMATLPRPLTDQQLRATQPVRRQIDALLDEYTDAQAGRNFNDRGLRTGAGDAFDTPGSSGCATPPSQEPQGSASSAHEDGSRPAFATTTAKATGHGNRCRHPIHRSNQQMSAPLRDVQYKTFHGVDVLQSWSSGGHMRIIAAISTPEEMENPRLPRHTSPRAADCSGVTAVAG
jgi:hypothetical protein